MIVPIVGADRAVTDWVVDHRAEPWTTLAHVGTLLGNTVTLAVVVAVVAVALGIRRHRVESVFLVVGSLVGYGLMVALKHLVARARPPRDDRLLHIETYSFPSGHAMMTMVVFGLLAVVAYRLVDGVREHPWWLALAPVLSVFVGLTRIYLGVHWMTDVIAGWVLGALFVALCAAVPARWWPRSSTRSVDN
ncbi:MULTISPECIES: phosphatase PAP2 family protein [unclassified Gordonia (in: high G+C Gram-positive bacteria)]